MPIAEWHEYILKITVYLVALIVSFFAFYAFDVNKIARNVHPYFKRLLHFCLMIGLAYLIGTFFLEFLPDLSNPGL